MGKVILDSDSVSKVSKGMDTLSSNVETILSNVRSYDVSSSDFDFSSAKDAIVNNLKGLETKVKNTNTLLDTVVKVHTELQESVEDNGSSNDTSTSTNTDASVNTKDPSSSSNSNSNNDTSYNPSSNYYGSSTPTDTSSSSSNDIQGGDGGSQPFMFAESATSENTDKNSVGTTAEVGSVISNDAVSLLDSVSVEEPTEKLEDVLKETNIKETMISDLANTVKEGMHIVIQGISTEAETLTYLKTVSSVAKSYKVSVEFVKLDNVLQYPDLEFSVSEVSSLSENKTSSTGILKVTTDEKGIVKVDDVKTTDKLADKFDAKTELVNAVQKGNKEIKSIDTIKTSGEVEIAESYTIKDKSMFDKLKALKCADKVELNYDKRPVTLIMKNNTVMFCKGGVLSEAELKSALASIDVVPTIK